MRKVLFILTALLTLATHGEAMAGGVLSPGAMYIDRADHMWTRGEETITSLNDAPESSSTLIPMLMLEYRVGDGGGAPLGSSYHRQRSGVPYRETYIGAPPSEWGNIGIGMKDYRPGRGALKWFVHIVPYKEVWEDPYLVGTPRTPTGSSLYGLTLAWEEVADTGWSVEAEAETADIEFDVIGSNEPDLRRDGSEYGIEVSYIFRPSDNLSIKLAIKSETGRFDGDANSYDGVSPGIGIKYTGKKVTADLSLYTSSREYKKAHPLFGTKLEKDTWGSTLLLVLPGAFGNRDLSVNLGAQYSETDSNIAFFDTKQKVAFFSVGFRI